MKLYFILTFFFFLTGVLISQDWMNKIQDPSNFYEIRSAYLSQQKEEKHDAGIPDDDELTKFRRWENFMEPRVFPSGQLPKSNCLKTALGNYNKLHSFRKLNSRSKKWISLEPDEGFPFNGNAGRVNCLAFHPIDSNIIYIGTPAGGLWKTMDGGITWSSLTDQIPSIGVSEIAINPVDPNIIYIATGDRDGATFGSNPYSYGILKSTDGGITWDTTGIQFMISNQMSVSRIIINPKNPDIIMTALRSNLADFIGIWRSEDAGLHWTHVSSGVKYDLEFHPGNPEIVYSCGYQNIQKSMDGGKTWTVINSSNLPLPVDIYSSKIAVTAAAPKIVFVEYINSSGDTYGLYKSSNSGDSWSKVNSLIINTQGRYDFDFAVSQLDSNFIVLGGIHLYFSTNGGKDFNQKTDAHVDHHGFYFRPDENALYDCNDGGLYLTYNNVNWINLNKGLHTFQYYRLSCSQTNNDFILTGAQDNGTLSHHLPNWQKIFDGDGMECAIDPSNDQIYYVSYQNGNFAARGMVSGSFTAPPGAGSTKYAWVTPFLIHPHASRILYVGGRDIFISRNQGESWENYSTLLTQNDHVGGGNILGMAISKSNPDQVMYAISYVVVYKTDNQGLSWTNVTSNLPTTAGCLDCSALSSILVHPDNPDIVWVTMSGYSKTNKVFQTIDGGLNWTNISGTLPAIPINTIVYEKDNDDALYIGTDIGVFFRNNKTTDWEAFMDGLPRVPIQELEIVEPFHKIRAATFGRGLWEATLKDMQVDVHESTGNVKDKIELYPNPNKSRLTVKMDQIKEDMEILFYNANGMQLYKHKLNHLTEEIEMPKYSSQILYYQINSKADKIQSGVLFVK